MQDSKERCRTLEDELASIRQCLNECSNTPLPKVRKMKDDVLEFDGESEFHDTVGGDSAQNSLEVDGIFLLVVSYKFAIVVHKLFPGQCF